MSTKEVVLFGLSGNPPTGDKGHRGIVKYLVDTGKFDIVLVLPVYQHQFATKKLETFEDRVNMCRYSMEGLSTEDCRVQVVTIEKVVNELHGGKHGSVDTLQYISQEFPDYNLHFVVGGDAINDICAGRWKNSDRYFER
jgi:nicotinic acid mononucleotide adenylyltransferase